MPDKVFFCLSWYRKYHLIAEHEFYFEEVGTRLLNQFGDIEGYAAKKLEEFDHSDEFGSVDTAYTPGFLSLLSKIRDDTFLAVTSSMYYKFDKQVREWIVHCVSDSAEGQKHCKDLTGRIWRANLTKIIDLLKEIGLFDHVEVSRDELLTYSHVVNVYKHGQGHAFKRLKESNPEFLKEGYEEIDDHEDWELYYGDDIPLLKIDYKKVEGFYEVILGFWKGIPAETQFYCDKSTLERLLRSRGASQGKCT